MIAAPWLPSCPVPPGRWRTRSLDVLAPLAQAEVVRRGGTRTADLSLLDQSVAPCWQVTRPHAGDVPGNVTVCSAAAWDPVAARVGAWMEFIERDCAERGRPELRIATASRIAGAGELLVRPADVPLPHGCEDPGDLPIAWARGHTLDGVPTWLPAHEVLCPYSPPPAAHNPGAWRSTGLAAGSHPTEAILFGLLEVIERDAVTVAELARVGTSVDMTSIDWDPLCACVRDMERIGLRVEIKALDALGGVYAFLAAIEDSSRQDPMQLVVGHGAHLDPRLAMERAVLEAVQARGVIAAGAREDLDQYQALRDTDYAEARRQMAWWFDATTNRRPAPAPAPVPSGVREQDLRDVVLDIRRRLAADGFDRIVVVDLSPPDTALSVFRVVVPGCSDSSRDNIRLGRRFNLVA